MRQACNVRKGRVLGETPDFTLQTLAARISERAQASADVSYTRKLIDRGIAHCAKKLGEEAVETAIAAIAEDRERVIAETADLLYHLLVVLEARGVKLAEVEAALAQRTGKTGLEEKAARSAAKPPTAHPRRE
jgi:phosphoribosyl-ATP pyrophosphohydrolase